MTASGAVPEYRIRLEDVNKVLEVSVLPKNGSGFTGAVQTTDIETPVRGEVPVATDVKIISSNSNGTQFSGGQTLTGNYTYSHPQNVGENNSTFQWYRNSTVIAGATQRNYKLIESTDFGSTITFGVTPVSSQIIDNIGLMVKSDATSSIVSVLEPIFLLDSAGRKWDEADNECKKQGASLASATQLQELFVRATSATVADGSQSNTEMCDTHGWPGYNPCVGTSSPGAYYWSSTPENVRNLVVNLTTGDTYTGDDTFYAHVACVK